MFSENFANSCFCVNLLSRLSEREWLLRSSLWPSLCRLSSMSLQPRCCSTISLLSAHLYLCTTRCKQTMPPGRSAEIKSYCHNNLLPLLYIIPLPLIPAAVLSVCHRLVDSHRHQAPPPRPTTDWCARTLQRGSAARSLAALGPARERLRDSRTTSA